MTPNKCFYGVVLLVYMLAGHIYPMHGEKLPTPTGEKTDFTVFICSYNNEQWCERNILSALNQDYDPHYFRIVYINDCSTDQTLKKVASIVQKHPNKELVSFVNNKKRQGQTQNKFENIHKLPDATVVVVLDGDDWFAHSHVLSRLAKEYDTGNTWMTYGQFIRWPSNAFGQAHRLPDYVHQQHLYRRYRGGITALRTYYARLFKNIKESDLKHEGSFFEVAGDMAILLPIAEMAGYHSTYIPDILYVYNMTNPISDFRTQRQKQDRFDDIARSMPPYPKLKYLLEPIA